MVDNLKRLQDAAVAALDTLNFYYKKYPDDQLKLSPVITELKYSLAEPKPCVCTNPSCNIYDRCLKGSGNERR